MTSWGRLHEGAGAAGARVAGKHSRSHTQESTGSMKCSHVSPPMGLRAPSITRSGTRHTHCVKPRTLTPCAAVTDKGRTVNVQTQQPEAGQDAKRSRYPGDAWASGEDEASLPGNNHSLLSTPFPAPGRLSVLGSPRPTQGDSQGTRRHGPCSLSESKNILKNHTGSVNVNFIR